MNPYINDEEKLRAEFARLKEANENSIEVSEDAMEEYRLTLLQEMEQNSPFSADEFDKILDNELSVFKEEGRYSYIKDLREAYSRSLSKPQAHKILETIPDHAFWDIKTPVAEAPIKHMNPYNPFRAYPYSSFFDLRQYEEYMDRRILKQNLVDGLSTYRRY